MRVYTAIIERDADAGLFVGQITGWPGAHSQGSSIEELEANLREAIEMLLYDGEPELSSEFVGTCAVRLA